MKRYLTAILFTLAISSVLVGCAGKVKYPAYYTLNLPPPPDPPAAAGVRTSVAIREFRAPGYLRQGPIVYRATPEQIGFYEYHRWAVDPRVFVTNAVVDHLRAGGQFAHVAIYDGRSDADYILSGRLERLEEVDYDGGVKVEVALSAEMRKLDTGVTVWTKTVSEVGTVPQRNVSAVVAEMNQAMDKAINELLSTLPASGTN